MNKDRIITSLLAEGVYGGVDLLLRYLGMIPGPEYYYVAIAFLGYRAQL